MYIYNQTPSPVPLRKENGLLHDLKIVVCKSIASFSYFPCSLILVCVETNPGPKGAKGKKSQNKMSSSIRKNSSKPPQIQSNIRVTHKYRFLATASMSETISSLDIIGAIGTIGVSTTSVTPFAESFKIKRVSIWSPAPSQGQTSTCSCEWLGTSQSPSIEVSDSSNSVADVAKISTSPPQNSNAAFWQTPAIASVNLFTLTTPAGSIVDLDLDFVLADDGAEAFGIAVATAVLQHPYYLALDGPTNNNLVPVSLTTTH
jgi:hypothetical protein